MCAWVVASSYKSSCIAGLVILGLCPYVGAPGQEDLGVAGVSGL